MPAASEQCEHQRDRDDEHHRRHQPRRLRPGMQVADHRARDHHHHRGPEALHQPRRHQRADARREGAAEGPGEEDRQPDIERRLAAELVAERAIGQLRDAEGGKEQAERRLHRLGAGAEVGGDMRQRRQIHVDRERPDGAEQADDQRDAKHGSNPLACAPRRRAAAAAPGLMPDRGADVEAVAGVSGWSPRLRPCASGARCPRRCASITSACPAPGRRFAPAQAGAPTPYRDDSEAGAIASAEDPPPRRSGAESAPVSAQDGTVPRPTPRPCPPPRVPLPAPLRASRPVPRYGRSCPRCRACGAGGRPGRPCPSPPRRR